MPAPDAIRDDDPARELRFALVITFAWCLVAVPWLTGLGDLALSREPTTQAGITNLRQLVPFWIGAAGMWVVLTLLMVRLEPKRFCYVHERQRIDAPTRRLQPRFQFVTVVLLILALGCAARFYVIFNHTPTLSDDIWRYVFDGYVIESGDNPYRISPLEIDPEHPRFAGEYALANRLNNPDLVTIYLPVSQLVFAAGAKISVLTDDAAGERVDPDHAAVVFRLVFLGFELVAMVVLAFALWAMRREAWYLALYVWHPLPIVELAGSGHQDVIGIALMLLALLIWQLRPRAALAWAPVLAIAGCVKPVVIPTAGFMARSQRDWLRQGFVTLAVGVVVCTALFAVFFAGPGSDSIRRFVVTVNRFVSAWAFHGSIYELLRSAIGSATASRRICIGVVGVITLLLLISRIEPWKATRIFLFAALLLSTTAWPWYLLWAFVLIPVCPTPALWIASLTMFAGYVVFGDMIHWRVPWWSPWLTYVPIYVALFVDLYWRMTHRGRTTRNRT